MEFTSKIKAQYEIKSGITPTVHLDQMTDIEIHFLMSWFFYHMPMDQRRKLMDEHPVIYKKAVKLVQDPQKLDNEPEGKGKPIKINKAIISPNKIEEK